MSNRFSLPDSLLDAVKDITKENKEVRQYTLGGITEAKMDPVGKADADIDNDGDVDKSDKYLHNRRKAIKKAMGKESKVVINPQVNEARGGADEPDRHIVMQLRKAQDVGGDHPIRFRGGKTAKVDKKHIDRILKVHDHPSIKPVQKRMMRVAISKSPEHLAKFANKLKEDYDSINLENILNESKNAPSKENGGIAHMCASHVQHAVYGEGTCIPGQHTIVETAPGEGYVTHYDVIFDGTIVENVSVDELEIIKEASHMHSNVKKDKKMIAGQKMNELSKKTLGSYINKAATSVGASSRLSKDFERDSKAARSPARKDVTKQAADIFTDRAKKRKAGISRAVGKLTKEETKVDSGLENPHNCATHVYSEQWGDGRTVTTMHADPDEYGQIAWYDVMFEHGIEKGVPIEELKVVKSESHMHSKRGKK